MNRYHKFNPGRALFAVCTALLTAVYAYAAPPTKQENPMVTMKTNHGTVQIELYKQEAPLTTQNFLDYVQAGFYDGLIFHRVIPDFMIQGGGFEVGMKQKSNNQPIQNEADNGLKNTRGTLSMARTGDPHSATSQFFINLKDNEFLDHTGKTPKGWGYAVFGKVVSGMDVIDKIAAVDTGSHGPHQDVPRDDVVITKMSVEP